MAKKRKKGYIPFMEVFGPTIQGEGMVVGQKTIFVRTAFCQYKCDWCDSKFTWDGSQEPEWITPKELANKVLELAADGNCNHITLTGGNPTMVGDEMGEFINIMDEEYGFQFSMETQGVNWQDWIVDIDQVVLSPKPPSSKMKTNMLVLDRIVDQLNRWSVNWTFKIVIFDNEDWEYARMIKKHFAGRYPAPFYLSVGNSNALEDGDISRRLLSKLEWLWDKTLSDPDFNDARPLPQLHTLVYNNKRGV